MVKLSDYGLPTTAASHEKKSTQWYLAPEALKGERELTSDLWSLGITLMELGEGKNPFEGVSADRIEERVCDRDLPSLSSEEWSADYVDFVGKCLVKDVKSRWDASELMEVRSCICG